MRVRMACAVASLGLVLVGCAGNAGPGSNGPGSNGQSAGIAASGSLDVGVDHGTEFVPEPGVQVGTLVPRGQPGPGASARVTPTAGGSVTLALDGGQQVVLDIPAGAVTEEVIVTLRAFRVGGVQGLWMEPEGLLLRKPGLLTLSRAAAVLLRIGAQADGDLYAMAPTTTEGAVPVVRLRPAIIEGESVEPTVLLADWPGPMPPAQGMPASAVDPLDGQAGQQEAGEAAAPDGSVEDPQGAQDLAAEWVPVLTQRCSDPSDPARARLAGARRSAGEQAPPQLPECLTRAVVVFASLESQMGADGALLVDVLERIKGEAEVTNEVEENLIPLEGEYVGEDRTLQLMADALRESDLDYEYGLRKDIAKDLIDALPEDATCRFNVPLNDGRMSVSLAEIGPGERAAQGQEFDAGLKVTVQPLSGTFSVKCGAKEQQSPAQVWGMVREIKGMAPDEPFVFLLKPGKTSSNAFSELQLVDRSVSRLMPDGTLELRVEGFVTRVSMSVAVYESMRALGQEREAAERAGAPSPAPS